MKEIETRPMPRPSKVKRLRNKIYGMRRDFARWFSLKNYAYNVEDMDIRFNEDAKTITFANLVDYNGNKAKVEYTFYGDSCRIRRLNLKGAGVKPKGIKGVKRYKAVVTIFFNGDGTVNVSGESAYIKDNFVGNAVGSAGRYESILRDVIDAGITREAQ